VAAADLAASSAFREMTVGQAARQQSGLFGHRSIVILAEILAARTHKIGS
jgi:hypothetical protein